MSLIKTAQQHKDDITMIIEACEEYNVPMTLLESLDGILHSYIQRINSGQMENLGYNDVGALANIFALSSMIGVTDANGVDTAAAGHILNLYKTAKPGDANDVTNQINAVIDELDPAMQQKFRNLANAWGKSLSQTIQKPTLEGMKNISNRLLKSVHLMQAAIDRMEQQHRGNIDKSSIQAASWRQGGILGRK